MLSFGEYFANRKGREGVMHFSPSEEEEKREVGLSRKMTEGKR